MIDADTVEAIGEYILGQLRGELAEVVNKQGKRQAARLRRIEANTDLILNHVLGLTGRVTALEGNCIREHGGRLEAVSERQSNAPGR